MQNPAFIERLKKMNAEVMGTTGDPYYGAPTIILVLTDRGYGNEVYDGSIVLQTMMLAAHEIGLGTCWIPAGFTGSARCSTPRRDGSCSVTWESRRI